MQPTNQTHNNFRFFFVVQHQSFELFESYRSTKYYFHFGFCFIRPIFIVSSSLRVTKWPSDIDFFPRSFDAPDWIYLLSYVISAMNDNGFILE